MLENIKLDIILPPFLIACLITTIITPIAIRYIKKFGLVDDPKRSNHPGIIHKKATPRGGGIPLFIGVLATSLLVAVPINQVTIALFVAALIALVIGVIDDKLNAKGKDVAPYLRFLVNILCAIIVVGSGVSIPFVTNPTGGILHLDKLSIPILHISISISAILTILWITWIMNMLNWSKGVDGQMPGIVAISAIIIGLLSLRFPLTDQYTLIDAKLSFIIAGASVGFLFFNFYPAKIFPGYGATSIYLLLAVMSFLSSTKLATAILVMGVPFIDGVFTVIRRILSGKNPFSNDNKHLHHLLLKLGFKQWQIALCYWLFSAILGILSLNLESRSKIFAIIMLVVIVFIVLSYLHLLLRQTHEKNTS